MRISFHDGERRQLLLAYEPGKSLNDLQDLFDGERYDIFGGGAALVLTRGVWNQVFSMDDPEMNYDSARALAKDYILEHEKIKGLKECELTCSTDAGAKDLMANYKCLLAYAPTVSTVLTAWIDKEKKGYQEIKEAVWSAAEAVVRNNKKEAQATRDHVTEGNMKNESLLVELLASAKKQAKQQDEMKEKLLKMEQQQEEAKKEAEAQQALKAADPPVQAVALAVIDDEQAPLEAETKEEEVQAQDETKEPEGPVPDKKPVGRLDMPKVTKFLKKKKDPKTPLEKAVTIEPAVATPLSEASFGEKGDGATPPPAPVQGAAKRVLELMNPPKGTPVVAQQLGKENADGAVSKLKAFVTSFGVKTEPGAKA